MSLAPSSSSSPLFSMVWAWEAGHGSISSEGLWLGSTSGMSSSRRVGRASSNYAKPGGVEDLGRRTKQGLLSKFKLLPHLLFFRPFNPALPRRRGGRGRGGPRAGRARGGGRGGGRPPGS